MVAVSWRPSDKELDSIISEAIRELFGGHRWQDFESLEDHLEASFEASKFEVNRFRRHLLKCLEKHHHVTNIAELHSKLRESVFYYSPEKKKANRASFGKLGEQFFVNYFKCREKEVERIEPLTQDELDRGVPYRPDLRNLETGECYEVKTIEDGAWCVHVNINEWSHPDYLLVAYVKSQAPLDVNFQGWAFGAEVPKDEYFFEGVPPIPWRYCWRYPVEQLRAPENFPISKQH